MYPDGEYDLAGFAVGAVEKSKIIDGSTIKPGDVVLGLASSGIHSNGYSLVRKIIERAQPDLNADFDGRSLADALMAPTRIYVKPLLSAMQSVTVKGMAHITGGGLVENIPRVLREGLTAELDHRAWPLPPLFCVAAEARRRRGCGDASRVQLRHRHGGDRRGGRCRCGDRFAVGRGRAGVEDRRRCAKAGQGRRRRWWFESPPGLA